jgi:2-dehydropantoate 2-reductase
MRICVFGAGAVGSFLLAGLARDGKDVCAVARGPHLAAMQAGGLRLESPAENFAVKVHASDDPAALGPQDLVIVATKTPALAQVARSIAPLLHEATAVAFAVNGVYWFYGDGFAPKGTTPNTARLDPDGSLHRSVGASRSLGMVVNSPNEIAAPGVVHNGRPGGNSFIVGEALPAMADPARASAIATELSGSLFTCSASPDIRRAMWVKLVRNVAGSPICSLTQSSLTAAYSDPDLRQLAIALMNEATAVGAAHGFDCLAADPQADVAAAAKLQHKPSMLQDLELGRPMEIDSQLAIVHDFARQGGVATPTLERLLPILMLRARTAGSYPA